MLVFDLSDRDSFLAVGGYLQHLTDSRQGVDVLLVGNKCDKPKKVTDRDLELFA